MKLALAGPNLPTNDETFHVHAADCQDLRGRRYLRADVLKLDLTDRTEVVEVLYPSDEFLYNPENAEELAPYITDIKFFPCVKDLA